MWQPAANEWVIAGTVMTGSIMGALDSSIINVALPSMSGTLGATIEQITWVITGYIREEQGIVMGVYGLGVVLAPAFGPTLGGWLTDNYSWPWIFYINVPIRVINLPLVSRFIEDPPYVVREKGSIDFPGLGLLILGLGPRLLVGSGLR